MATHAAGALRSQAREAIRYSPAAGEGGVGVDAKADAALVIGVLGRIVETAVLDPAPSTNYSTR